MSDTGLKYVASAANVAGVGAVNWSNPSNAVGNNVTDATNASADLSGPAQSKYLIGTFSLGLTGADTVVGVVAAVRWWSTKNDSQAPTDTVVKLVKNGTVGGNNKAVGGELPQSGAWSTDRGANNDTWGLSFVGTDTMGLAVSIQGQDPTDSAYITAMRVTVYYTTSSGVKFRRRLRVRVGSRSKA